MLIEDFNELVIAKLIKIRAQVLPKYRDRVRLTLVLRVEDDLTGQYDYVLSEDDDNLAAPINVIRRVASRDGEVL